MSDLIRDWGPVWGFWGGVGQVLAIAVLLRYISRHSFGVFALYRLALGALILTLLATRG